MLAPLGRTEGEDLRKRLGGVLTLRRGQGRKGGRLAVSPARRNSGCAARNLTVASMRSRDSAAGRSSPTEYRSGASAA